MEPSGEVESMLALLESGRPLPPDPREAGTTREDAASFTARLDKIVARYESQFLKRHEWQVGPAPEFALLPATWRQSPLLTRRFQGVNA